MAIEGLLKGNITAYKNALRQLGRAVEAEVKAENNNSSMEKRKRLEARTRLFEKNCTTIKKLLRLNGVDCRAVYIAEEQILEEEAKRAHNTR